MDFFSSLPSPVESDDDADEAEFERDDPDWLGAPSSVLGGPVAVSGVIHRSEHVFIGLQFATAYPTGVSFDVQIAVRRGDWPRDAWEDLKRQIFGHPLPASSDAGDLHIGVELADGTRTAADSRWGRRARAQRDQIPDAPVLVDHGGSGSGGGRFVHTERDLWLWPLPAGNTLDLVVAWPALDVPETRFAIDANELRAAATRAIPYWDR